MITLFRDTRANGDIIAAKAIIIQKCLTQPGAICPGGNDAPRMCFRERQNRIHRGNGSISAITREQ